MSDYIPNHLLANVLLRLPFDSLLQSRRVSKSWRALIDSSDFIKIHFNKAYQEANSPSGIKIIGLNQNNFYTLVLDLEADSSSITTSAKQLNCPSDYSGSKVCLKGSCNGLLCLMYPDTDKITLWNPWIQKSWELPSFPIEYHTRGRAIFHLGFGYDRVNDEYKVLNRIRFSDLCDRDQWYDEVYVYSSKQNSWRRMKHFPFKQSNYHCYCAPDCVLADGALHWFMRERQSNGVIYIISFDLSSEEFQKMPCPMIPWPLGYFQHNLKVLNGSLCLVLYYDVGGGFGADIWVMENYGVDKSWTKLTSVTMPGWTFWSLTPLALSKNKRQLLLQIDGVKLVLHDLETKRISDLATRGDVSFVQSSCTCIGSLVRPFGTD